MALVHDWPLSLDWLGKDGGLGVSIRTVQCRPSSANTGEPCRGHPRSSAVLCRLRMMQCCVCCGVLRYLRWIGSGSGLTGAKVGAGPRAISVKIVNGNLNQDLELPRTGRYIPRYFARAVPLSGQRYFSSFFFLSFFRVEERGRRGFWRLQQ